ncbi:MAG: hypothetical protein AAFV85_09210 [Cyanobacteria bacterium J06634_6]
MSAENIASTALLFLGVVLGPLIFFASIVAYGVKRIAVLFCEYRERRYLRSLPCGRCQYFANDEFLKCAVNPLQALTDEAHHCRDFAAMASSEITNEYDYYLKNKSH